MKSELVYAPDGSATGVRHHWTFDDLFSAYATQGLDAQEKGEFTREELAPLAQVNVESLKDFDYFTFAKANGGKTEFKDADRLLPRLQCQDDRAHAALHAAVQGAGQGAGSRCRNL